jgi:hypothetical protein
MSYGQVETEIELMREIEKEPRFRNLMYAIIGLLIVGYIGIKARHVSIAVGAYQGQVLDRDTSGAAK